MASVLLKGVLTFVFATLLAADGGASPRSSKLLSLVPPGAEVVAGFQGPEGARQPGRLLLTTHNNRIDREDWQAVTGVDSQRKLEEAIEVAASNAAGGLAEHMLLVAGRFDRELIFRSLEQAGSESTEYQGQRILLIKPFARERGDMLDIRWLAVLDNRIGVFGTSGLVQRALRRYVEHSLPDPVLEERLSLLHPHVTCWNVLSGSRRSGKLSFVQPHSALAELQQDTDLLIIGARFGSKPRIDFSIHARTSQRPEFLINKAAFFTDGMVAGPGGGPVSPAESQRRVKKISVGPDHVQGSVELSAKQFEAWCKQFTRPPVASPPPPARGD